MPTAVKSSVLLSIKMEPGKKSLFPEDYFWRPPVWFLSTCRSQSRSLVKPRINCMNFPAHLLGTLQQILFALDPAFVFPFWEKGWGASACVDHLSWDSGQRRMREGEKGRRIQGAERERWSKTEMDEQRVRDCGVKRKFEEGGSKHRCCGYNDRDSGTQGACL